MQKPEGTNDSGVPGDPSNTMDTNAILTNMVALFQQFLASIANKDDTNGTGTRRSRWT
jgi:hypothetical protein